MTERGDAERSGRVGLWLTLLVIAWPTLAIGQPLDIRLAHGSPAEAATKAQLERLLTKRDLSAWRFISIVVIDETAIPHSHPVLTLHTRHRRDDDLLLSTYVHEQAHWLLAKHPARVAAAVTALKARYPDIPVGYPQGSDDAEGNYVHLIVCYLELQADKAVLGELRAHAVAAFWAQDHYTWIYQTLLEDSGPVRRAVREAGLERGLHTK